MRPLGAHQLRETHSCLFPLRTGSQRARAPVPALKPTLADGAGRKRALSPPHLGMAMSRTHHHVCPDAAHRLPGRTVLSAAQAGALGTAMVIHKHPAGGNNNHRLSQLGTAGAGRITSELFPFMLRFRHIEKKQKKRWNWRGAGKKQRAEQSNVSH